MTKSLITLCWKQLNTWIGQRAINHQSVNAVTVVRWKKCRNINWLIREYLPAFIHWLAWKKFHEFRQRWQDNCPITSTEVINMIDTHLNQKKAPCCDIITVQMLKELPRKTIRKLTHLFNAVLWLRYIMMQWKVTEAVMIPKLSKPPEDNTSYWLIYFLLIISKLFKKILLQAYHREATSSSVQIPNKHSTINWVHRKTDVIKSTLEEKIFV